MPGRLFAVVGPSGAGKDTVMDAVADRRPDLHMVRRVITRPSDAGGEAFEGVSEAEFLSRLDAGAFALNWGAHGLRYGIPTSIDGALAGGQDVMFNGSRGILTLAAQRYSQLVVLHVTATHDVLAQRLAQRGRESAADIAARLKRADYSIPGGLNVVHIDNSADLSFAVNAVLAALQPQSV